MHRISRIYFGNYGHKMCWYDGLLLNFIDEQRGEPTDYILQLENGGGKSTLLAGLFSCFETSQNRFLKHLQENRNRFSEYFSSEGTPGFIIVEWMIPTSGPQEFRRIVTGQVVAIRNKISSELERVFFSFETAPDLALESVPAPKLNSSPANSMDDFTRWLARLKREYKGNVFDTRNQTEWEKHLEEERGIDIGMLKLQLEFSRMEGSIDTAFLNFRNETEFVQKFLSLTMDADQAAAVRNSVITACDKLKRKPEFEKRLNVLTDLHARLQLFESAATELQISRENFEKCELHSARLVSTLYSYAGELKLEAQSCNTVAREIRAGITNLQEMQIQLDDNLKSANFLKLRRRAESCQANYNLGKSSLNALRNEIRHISAAKLLAAVMALRSQREETYTITTLAEEGLRPFAEQARIQGKILKELLLQHKLRAEQKSEEAKLQAQVKKHEREKLKEQIALLSKSISSTDRNLALLQSELQRYDDTRKRWYAEGVLESDTELLSQAILRLQERIKFHHSAQEAAESLQSNCEIEIKQLGVDLSEIKQMKATKEGTVKNLQRQLADAESLREAVSQDLALCRAAESQIVDPDAEALVGIIEKYIAEVQRMRDAAAVVLANLNRDRTEIETSGLSASNPDVQSVISLLFEKGIKTACSFNSYIAKTESDPQEARELVLSNPARFLGVAIKTEKELAQAKLILETPPALSKPVLVSLTKNNPDELASGFVVAADNDAAYNFKSAKKYAAELSERLDEQRRLSSEYESMHTAAVEGRQKLFNYSELYGRGRLNKLKQELLILETEISELQHTRQTKEREIVEKESERDLARGIIKTESHKVRQLSETVRLVDRDCEQLEKPADERREKFAEMQTELSRLQVQRSKDEESAESASQAFMRDDESAREYWRHAEDFQKEITAIRHCDDQFDADASLSAKPLPLVAARELYENAARTLDYEERQHLGILKKELENIEKSLSEKELEYSSQFNDLAEDKVALLVSLDFSTEMIRLKSLEVEADFTFEEAKSESTIADSELKQFKRKHQNAESGSEHYAALTDDELSSQLESIPNTIEANTHEIATQNNRCIELAEEERTKHAQAELLENSASQLKATIDCQDEFEADKSLIPEQPSQTKKLITQLITENKLANKKLELASQKTESAFQVVQKSVFSTDLTEAEPDLAMVMSNHNFKSACEGAERITSGVADRMAVAQGWLESVKADFDATVEELHNLVNEGIRILNQSCNKRIPENAPYLGGKPVLKMKVNLNAIPTEQRRLVLGDFMDSVIRSGMAHKLGTDMVADAIQKLAGRSLGILIAKLTREESEQYASADKLSNSGGEAVSMALFLYILTAQVRAEMQADLRRQPGGPLILDNPFAKASSPFIWRAQRAFARAMGVQLIFATATKDLETLGEFEHFIYLRKAGINNRTGRYHIEQVDLTLNKVHD